MTKRFKKGDKVTMVKRWSSPSGRFINVRRCVVTSWGKVQGTLVDHETGDNRKIRMYTNMGLDLESLIGGHDPSDIERRVQELMPEGGCPVNDITGTDDIR